MGLGIFKKKFWGKILRGNESVLNILNWGGEGYTHLHSLENKSPCLITLQDSSPSTILFSRIQKPSHFSCLDWNVLHNMESHSIHFITFLFILGCGVVGCTHLNPR